VNKYPVNEVNNPNCFVCRNEDGEVSIWPKFKDITLQELMEILEQEFPNVPSTDIKIKTLAMYVKKSEPK